MTEALLPEQIEHLLARWLVGGAQSLSASRLPAAWLHQGDVDELDALALVGQCRQMLWIPALPASARPGRALPVPLLHLLPDPLRPRFRRVARNAQPVALTALLWMLARRGCMAHPFDWLPQAGQEGLPEAYAPWQAWVATQPGQPEPDDEPLSDLSPAQRRRQLRRLRTRDPALAREQVARLLPDLGAEQRLALVELLSEGLGADDLPLLEQLARDRSDKVRQTAARLRERLGQTTALDESARRDVLAWFELGPRGILDRRPRVRLTALKTRPQHAARRAQLDRLGWGDLCALLQLEPMALAEAWEAADEEDDALWECAVHTAPVAVVERLLQRVLFGELKLGRNPMFTSAWTQALDRLADPARTALARRALAESSLLDSFAELLQLAGGELEAVDSSALRGSVLWPAYQDAIAAQVGAGSAADSALARENLALAALLPQATARALLQFLAEAGLRAGDPALDALLLNAELDPRHCPTEDRS